MPNTFTKISSVTVGSGGASSIDFTSIPQTYTDLKIIASLRLSSGGDGNLFFKFNNSTASVSWKGLYGDGSAAGSNSSTSTGLLGGIITGATNTASVFGSAEIYIPNYTSSSNKSASANSVSENNATSAYIFNANSLWSNTSAITRVTLYEGANVSFAQNSTATLYGILKA